MSPDVILAVGLTFQYPGRSEYTLRDFSCHWHKGTSILLTGRNGSGKSTIGKLLKGLLEPTSGRIEFQLAEGRRVASSRERMRSVAWVDAQPERQIFASTVREEVGFGLAQSGANAMQIEKSVRKALETVGLDPESYLDRSPFQLSGGEKRRVAIASIVASPSDFIIFDEPGAGLDDVGIEQFRSLAGRLKSGGAGVMVISHDLDDFADLAGEVITLDNQYAST